MDESLRIEEYKKLLFSMDELTSHIQNVIFLNYFDSNKYLYSIYVESFNSIKDFCVLIGNGFLISQACSLLRMAIESTSIIRILEKYPQLLDEYIEHSKFRFSIKDEKQQRDKIIEHYSDKIILDRRRALDYLDYGWISEVSKDYGFHSLIRLAGFDKEPDKLLPWIDTLNMWVHGTLVSINVLNGDNAIIYAHVLVDMAAKLLDILCCEFHNENKFDFKIDGVDYFSNFRKAYIDVKPLEDEE